jgi:hypothetical protein
MRGRFSGIDGDADVIRHLRYGGVTAVVLIDNAKEFVEHHDAVNREVRFNEVCTPSFAIRTSQQPLAPYRARTNARPAMYRRTRSLVTDSRVGRHPRPSRQMVARVCRPARTCRLVKPADRFVEEIKALRPLAGRAPSESCVICSQRSVQMRGRPRRTAIRFIGIGLGESKSGCCWTRSSISQNHRPSLCGTPKRLVNDPLTRQSL